MKITILGFPGNKKSVKRLKHDIKKVLEGKFESDGEDVSIDVYEAEWKRIFVFVRYSDYPEDRRNKERLANCILDKVSLTLIELRKTKYYTTCLIPETQKLIEISSGFF